MTVNQGHHVDAEGVLQLREFVEVIEHHIGHNACLQVNHYAHTVFIGFIAKIGNPFNLFLVDQMRNAFDQHTLIDLIRNFIDHNTRAAAVIEFFVVRFGAHEHTTAPRTIAFNHPL